MKRTAYLYHPADPAGGALNTLQNDADTPTV